MRILTFFIAIVGLIVLSGCATVKQPDILNMTHNELVEMARAVEASRGKKVFSAVGPDGKFYISSRPIDFPKPEDKSVSNSENDLFSWAKENVSGAFEMEVSAYYGPLPDQKKYATGSYEEDIRLNGKGVRTSGGVDLKKHFRENPGVGIAAASLGYKGIKYGTKLFVLVPEELKSFFKVGLVEVCDTGLAIVENRLDIFMGWGDEGLRKACQWGRRTVKVYEIRKRREG